MKRIVGILLLLAHCGALVLAGEPRRITRDHITGEFPVRPGEIIFVSNLRLEPVSAADLTFGPPSSTVDMGRWDARSPAQQIAPVRLQVTRTVPAAWRIRLADTDNPTATDVRYEVFGANGEPRRLTHIHHPEAELGVVIEPLPPQFVGNDGEGAVLEGGFVLQLSLDRTRFAGEYSGTVVISVNTF